MSSDGKWKHYTRTNDGQYVKGAGGTYRLIDGDIELTHVPQNTLRGGILRIVQINKTELLTEQIFVGDNKPTRVLYVRKMSKK